VADHTANTDDPVPELGDEIRAANPREAYLGG
jgi:hypothetical protein